VIMRKMVRNALSKSLADTLDGDGGKTRTPQISHAYETVGTTHARKRRNKRPTEVAKYVQWKLVDDNCVIEASWKLVA
jgi:hypothetical protein